MDTADLEPVLDAAMAAGLRLWDTAQVYGGGSSEQILGRLASRYPREELILSTEFTPQIAPESQNSVRDLLEGSLENLHTDSVDIYWIHNPSDVERWTPFLAELVQTGKVGRIGVSNHNLEQLQRAQEILAPSGVRITAVQNHYSLLYRSSEDAGIVEYCAQEGIDFFAYMVLEQGALSGKYDAEHPMPADSQRGRTYNPILPKLTPVLAELSAISQDHQATVPQVAMAWAITKGTIPIIGVTKAEQVNDAAQAAALELSPTEMSRLEDVAAASGAQTRGGWEAPMV
ncbi:aldo/keto reductase [Kocuria subflava]|uniref:aldo/keto reductase n=1 Tax=Kocuria subflava TaxID=1736139 RepID=UPI003158CACA